MTEYVNDSLPFKIYVFLGSVLTLAAVCLAVKAWVEDWRERKARTRRLPIITRPMPDPSDFRADEPVNWLPMVNTGKGEDRKERRERK